MRCGAKGCQQSADIDALCLTHYVVANGVTLVEAILERNRRQAAIKESQDEIVAKAQADFRMQMDMQETRMGSVSRAVAAKPKCKHEDCMRDSMQGTTGLCPNHYQEYLNNLQLQHEAEQVRVGDRIWFRNKGRILEGHVRRVLGEYIEVTSKYLDFMELPTIPLDQKGMQWEFKPLPLADYALKEMRSTQEPDDHNPWHSHPCAEDGCKMDGREEYGLLCRDHYYERKHGKRRWLKELPGMSTLAAIVYVPMFAAGLLFGWPYIVASWGVLCAGVLGNQVELGLVQGWKRADKPRPPSKNAAKTQPFSLPNV